ncbi:T9SS type A sorting domain-containing protein [Flagellimonas pelagia]|uniref:T9SS C-terminal target domain-containing protein n=2 Tax=Flagellimonas pelagia TaxID=2306998 RepID=A0A3A1NF24_9FLAO|nr:T9SS C-terminal target domain-containing protein [Allomuricauda maritima]TXJ90945.1 T9SS type A sorting domain-containing protein [Allomuricauda maritima]
MTKRILIFLGYLFFTGLVFSQQNAVYTISAYYSYYHQVDGNTTTAGSSAYVALNNGQGNYIGETYITSEENLDLTYYRYRSYSFVAVNPANSTNYCNENVMSYTDEFLNQMVPYCDARIDLQDRSVSLGKTVEYGNKNNVELLGTYSALNCYAKSWLLPYEPDSEIPIGYCDYIFERDGFQIEGGQWEYLVNQENVDDEWKPIEDDQIKSLFPLKITAEELDESIQEDLKSLGSIMLRFRLTAQGSGQSNRFKQGMNDSGILNSLSSPQHRLIGPFTVDVSPCIPVLDPLVNPNPAPISPTCNGGQDGGFKITFDQELGDDEKMQIIVYKKTGPNQYAQDQEDSNKDLKTIDFNGKTYIFKGTALKAGNYGVKWMVGPIQENAFSVVESDFVDITIIEPSAVTIVNPVIHNVTCEGVSDGEITITPSGGTPPYAYDWKKNGNSFPLPQGSTNTHLVNLQEGAYSVFITDAHNCGSEVLEFLVDATYSSPKLDSYQVFQPGTSPNYLPTGSILIGNIIDGSGDYTLHWKKDGLDFQPQNPMNPSGLESGTYTLTIEDNVQGCFSEEYAVIIIELDPLTIEFTETMGITCEGDMGILKAQGVGGTNSYAYLWSTGEQTQSINVGQGLYSVTVTDTGDESLEAFYEFNYANPLLTVVENKTNVICKGEATGSIGLEISGGTGGPYSVTWLDAPIEGPLRTDLPAGNYVYFVSDENCQISNEGVGITIAEPEAFFTVSKVSQSNISLNGESDGTSSISLEHGTSPYIFEWSKNDEPFQPSEESTETNLVGLEVGSYQVMVTDANGCNATLEQPIIITEPDPLAIVDMIATPVNCKGDNTGTITAMVTGIPPFTYHWVKQGDVSFSASNQKTISDLSSGTYILFLKDASVVPQISSLIEITEPDSALEVQVIPYPTTCFTGKKGSAQIMANGGSAPYLYSIDRGVSFQSEPIFNDLESGTYDILITDMNQCEYTSSITIGLPGQSNADFAITSRAFVDESVLAVDLSYPVPDQVEWVIPEEAIVLSKDADQLEIAFQQPGEYEVGIKVYRDDCLSTETKTIVILESDGTIPKDQQESKDDHIEHFVLYPNPTNGKFMVDIVLREPSSVGLQVFGLANNTLIRHEQVFGSDSYQIPMDISGLPSGLYVVVMETQFGYSLQKVILK